eukprot:CAMPEP_0182899462 /NCGR_PEP_ID=MMETSP0034_2-20130328/28088_1 /TAXON_ID=156128 /ORGANISM="Nephroselmis pyriformis, Strain CCMP717" /LENGTH=266 /DNA_ID=CAMNT_0025033495 /DNA_START=232 /DNA_END=1028 /DNA_ORIENTATION=-
MADRGRRAMPTEGWICQERWIHYTHGLHRNNVINMKASVDSSSPRNFPHLQARSKKWAIQEQRFKEIELENKKLLEKMANISRSSSVAETKPLLGRYSLVTLKPGIYLDQNLRPSIDSRNVHHQNVRSLNRETRRRELLKISEENIALLARIQAGRTVIPSWRVHDEKQRVYRSILERKRPPTATPPELQAATARAMSAPPENYLYTPRERAQARAQSARGSRGGPLQARVRPATAGSRAPTAYAGARPSPPPQSRPQSASAAQVP